MEKKLNNIGGVSMGVKSEVLQLRLSSEEKAMIQQNAEKLGLPMARYLVMLVLQDKERKEKN